MTSLLRYRRSRRGLAAVCAAAAAAAIAFAVSPAVPAAVTDSRAAGAPAARVRVGAGALGTNVAPWDYSYAPGDGAAPGMQRMLKAAGVGMLHYGGGQWADFYDWQTNSDIQRCLPNHATASFTSSCSTGDALDFTRFSRQARALGAGSFVSVNYGSGTPALAARWVTAARTVPGEGVRLWEVGNESYGCWEVDNELAGAPEHFKGYTPDTYANVRGIHENPTCPQVTLGSARGTALLATSYAVNSLRFLKAMRKADPAARIGVPWAFGANVHGAEVPYAGEWNRTVLRADGRYASFVDARWYPYGFSGRTGTKGGPTDAQLLRSLTKIPALYQQIRQTLDAYDPEAGVVVGETGMSNAVSLAVCQPVGAVFAAGDALSWLAAGASTVDWFDLNNHGNMTRACRQADNGLLTSSDPPAAETPYWGYLLASKLAVPGAALGTIGVAGRASKSVLAFESVLPGGRRAVALVNTGTAPVRNLTLRPFAALTGGASRTGGAPRTGGAAAGRLRTWTYSKAVPRIVAGTARAGAAVTLPAESVRVLQTP